MSRRAMQTALPEQIAAATNNAQFRFFFRQIENLRPSRSS